ncbi:MAG: M20 aminoacylase family protein [Alphaproteobacteria bacterium]|jgi:hippurate hydrolase|nr:M20 aminoacylase family protein [Alphaproteobacteria bacterium]
MAIIDRIAEFHDEMTAWRRDIHAHPELGFEENRTADIVAEKLEGFGIDVHRGLGKTGVVGSLRVGNAQRTIGLRADMDALPILEANTFDYRSRFDGKMHACGHDGHTTMLLGAAKYLAETRDFDGCVHFIFQPAEEGIGGAKAMVEDGLFETFPMEAVFGMHNGPGLGVGKFAIRPGPMMAGGAFFDIDITGVGAHGARPESGIDPVVVAAHITTALQTIVSRNADPVDTAVVSTTQIHSGDAYNVIPERARLSGTVRVFRRETMALVEERMRAIAEGVARGHGATAQVDFREIFLPLVNTPEEAEFCADIAADVVGEDKVERRRGLIMASEDFSYMLDACPGAYINIGNGDGEGTCQVHNPGYDFNDEILALGASYWSRLVETRLAREGL